MAAAAEPSSERARVCRLDSCGSLWHVFVLGVVLWIELSPLTDAPGYRIDDHIEYLMIRVDPDKVAPLKDASASRADLAGPAQ